MLTIGITGGIGSGKTTICRIFEVLEIPVFYADTAAREVMEKDPLLRAQVISLLGEEAYPGGVIDRKAIAQKVFGDGEKLAALNALVHPATARAWEDFQQKHHTAPYLIKEAAILFESGAHRTVDKTVCITAPESLRLSRAMARDSSSEEAIRSRMARQMPESEKLRLCDFVVVNDDVEAALPQVLALDTIFRRESIFAKIHSYILKVWASTIVGTPLFLAMGAFLANFLKRHPFRIDSFILDFGGYMLFFGFLFSLPVLSILLLLSPLVVKFIQKPALVKILLFAIELVFIFLTTSAIGYIFDFGTDDKDFELLFSGAYGAATAIFSFIYRLAPKNPAETGSE